MYIIQLVHELHTQTSEDVHTDQSDLIGFCIMCSFTICLSISKWLEWPRLHTREPTLIKKVSRHSSKKSDLTFEDAERHSILNTKFGRLWFWWTKKLSLLSRPDSESHICSPKCIPTIFTSQTSRVSQPNPPNPGRTGPASHFPSWARWRRRWFDPGDQ